MRRVLYAAPIDFTRKEFESAVIVDELQKRLQLTFGSYIANLAPGTNLASVLSAGGSFGLVSTYDPGRAPLELAVLSDQNSAATVAIQPGMAVFPNGEIIVIDTALSGIALASTAPGAVNVVYLQFSEEEVDPQLTRGNVNVYTRVVYLTNPNNYLGSVSISTWQGFSSLDLSTKIPLAVVSVDSNSVLQIDQSRSFLTTNRPWFSPVDIQHRSQLGTGVVTAANAHGLSVNDLSAGTSTPILSLMNPTGQVVSNDSGLSKVPGHMCQDLIPSGQVLQDTTGEVTGVQNAYYFWLSRYPSQLVRTTIQNTGQPNDEVTDLGAMLVPGRNLVVLGVLDEQLALGAKNLICEYLAVDAMSPTDQPLITQSLVFRGPYTAADETIIANGLVVTAPILTAGMADAGPFPSLYRAYLRGDGFVYKTPQPVFCYQLLASLGTAVTPASISLLGPARLRVGLTGATAGPNLSVQVKLTGTDTTNAQITETITFGAQWTQDISIGTTSEAAILASRIYQMTNKTFQTLTNVQIVQALNAGSAAAVAVWADHDQQGTSADPLLTGSTTGSGAARALPLVDFVWDGARVQMDASATKPLLRDVRPVATSALPARSSARMDALPALYEQTGVSTATWLALVEDFDKPLYVANRYVYENASPHTPGNADELPRFQTTRMSKLSEGLGRLDQYVSRPLMMRPYAVGGGVAAPARLRFTPIGRGPYNYKAGGVEGFSLWARVYLSDGYGWSSWSNVTQDQTTTTLQVSNQSWYIDLLQIPYPGNVFLSVTDNNKLIKFQFCVHGPVRGLACMVDFSGPPMDPVGIRFESGIWNQLGSGR